MPNMKRVESAKGKAGYRVFYTSESGAPRRQTFDRLEDACLFFFRLEDLTPDMQTINSIENRRAWSLEALTWFFLGYQMDRMERHAIKLATFAKCRSDLLAIDAKTLSRPVTQVAHYLGAATLTAGARQWLKSAYGLLKQSGTLSVNPMEKPEKKSLPARRIMSHETISTMLASALPRERLAVYLGAAGGLRLGELLALNYLSITPQWLDVRQTLTPEGVLQDVKKSALRRLPVSKELLALLDVDQLGKDAPVIAKTNGKPLSKNYTTRGVMRDLLAAFGVIRFNDLRSVSASRLIARKAPLHTVAYFMGMTQAEVMRVYGHLFPPLSDADLLEIKNIFDDLDDLGAADGVDS